jgi:hypothetical protein
MEGMVKKESISRYAYAILREMLFPVVLLFIMTCFSRYVESTGNVQGYTICMKISVVVGFFCMFYYAIAAIYANRIHKKATDYSVKFQENNITSNKHFNAFLFLKILINRGTGCSETRTRDSETDILQISQSNLIDCDQNHDSSITFDHAAIASVKSNNKERRVSKFQKELDSINPKLLNAMIEHLRSITYDRTMHYGCMITWLCKHGLMNYNSLCLSHIQNSLKNTYGLDCPFRTNLQQGIGTIQDALKSRQNNEPEDKMYEKYLKCYDEIVDKFSEYLKNE